MSLTVEARLADRNLDVSFTVPAGKTLAILGPNGAGKSTTLDIIAGLVRPDSGRARLGTTPLFDVGPATPGHWLAPHLRGVSLLAQDALLFPHLSVLDNVAFAPTCAGRHTSAARTIARTWLDAVDAIDLAARRPAELSGGQAQRVALARALAAEPRLLLLDEPLAAMDAARAPALRRLLRGVLADRSAIIVTHEILDALTLADHIIVMNTGRIVEAGTTREVLQQPRHPFTAQLTGLNLVTGECTRDGLRTSEGWVLHGATAIPSGVEAAAAFRPSAVTVHRALPPSVGTVVRRQVHEIEARNELVRVRAGDLFADITPANASDLDLAPDSDVYFAIDPGQVTVYPLERQFSA
ncbi:MAG TPA: ABC transporter ATP-binding protein [Glaciibacter sp.]|nr:ABC transporter ATP-binding protein [Glaciibacter sp.]